MRYLIFTIIAAIIIMGLVVLGFAIGKLLTGKNRLRKGCGMTPKDPQDNSTSCHICGSRNKCEEEDDD
ncbi:MAG: hypothetical protein ACKVOH_06090 [Chlamydiales bacterium]